MLAHLLHGRVLARPLAQALLRQVLRQQAGALGARLRHAGAGPAGWRRLARLASFAELAPLLAGPARGHRGRTGVAARALAALDQPAAGLVPAARLFLKTALLGFRLSPTAGWFSLAAARQLAAALGLPWQALGAQLRRWQQQVPALAATPFFARLGPLLPGGPPGRADARLRLHPPTGSAGGRPGQLPPTAGQEVAVSAAPAATDALLHYLLHGQAPWWAAPPPGPGGPAAAPAAAFWAAQLRQARHLPALRQFVPQQATHAAVRRRLATLADFSLLHELSAGRGPGRVARQLLRPALAGLDRLLRTSPARASSRFQRFLREAFLAAAVAGQPAAGALPGIVRQLARAAGLPWHYVLAGTGRLLHQLPALAASPFFAALRREANRAPAAFSVRARRRPALPAPPEAAAQALEQYLHTGRAAGPAAQGLAALLGSGPPATAALARLRPYLRLAEGRRRLALLLPSARELLALVRGLFPAAHRPLAAPLRQWLQLLAGGHVRLGAPPARLWALVLAAAQQPRPAAALAPALLRAELEAQGQPLGAARQQAAARQLLRLAARPPRPLPALAALLAAHLAAPPPAPEILPPPAPARPRPAAPAPAPPPLPGPQGTYLLHAGLVLLWPFLPALFERLGYLEQRQFAGAAQAERAVHLLHFLATGQQNPPEPLLLPGKVLCGVAPAQPLARELALTESEKATGEDLLRAVLGRWDGLHNTSLAGLRETFLQRGGKLAVLPDRSTLTVETKTVDVLLDRRPWSIALIKLPWMAFPLYVTWR